jgi:uncharacterized protein
MTVSVRLAANRPQRYIHRMATKDFIGYQALLNQALLGVVRAALTHAAKGGVMAQHHFYVTFDTKAPGVQLSDFMRERFPEQITIVLQNHYWDLKVHDVDFEVGLSFNKMPETVVVPFDAIVEFRDPSQNFGFQIRPEGMAAPTAQKAAPKIEPAGKVESQPAPAPAAKTTEEPPEPHDDKPTVVSLDKFRKK